jgi:hypothetical protein
MIGFEGSPSGAGVDVTVGVCEISTVGVTVVCFPASEQPDKRKKQDDRINSQKEIDEAILEDGCFFKF